MLANNLSLNLVELGHYCAYLALIVALIQGLAPIAAHYLRQGQPVSMQHGRAPGWVRIYEGEDRFLGMGQVLDDGRVAPRRLVAGARKL